MICLLLFSLNTMQLGHLNYIMFAPPTNTPQNQKSKLSKLDHN